MKRKIAFGVMFLWIGLFFFNCESGPPPGPPPRNLIAASNVPSYLSISLNRDGFSYTIKNTDSVDHRVVVDVLTDRNSIWTFTHTVNANDILQVSSGSYSDGYRAIIRQIAITDWI
jgi:hypothetical protein